MLYIASYVWISLSYRQKYLLFSSANCIFFSLFHSFRSQSLALLSSATRFRLIHRFRIEKSRTMEAVYYGIWIAVSRFSDIVNVAIHRSTSAATWNVSTGKAIIGNWWHSDKSGAGALWKWKPIDLVRYVLHWDTNIQAVRERAAYFAVSITTIKCDAERKILINALYSPFFFTIYLQQWNLQYGMEQTHTKKPIHTQI